MIPTTLALDSEWVQWESRYLWHIDQIPGLIEVMRDSRVPLAASQTDKVVVSGSKADANPVPIRFEQNEYEAPGDALWAALVEYTVEVADALHEPHPHVLRASWFYRGAVAGLRASTDSRTARAHAFEVVAWLADRVQKIAPLAGVQTGEEFLFELIRKARGRHVIARPRRARPRVCEVCGEQAVHVEWMDVPGRIGPALPVGRCSECGQQYEWKATA